MAKHDQRIDRKLMTCSACRDGNCHRCIDVLRSNYSDIPVCTCDRKHHKTEAGLNG